MGRRHEYDQKLMDEIFEGFEYRIYEKLQSVDSMLARISMDASTSGISPEVRHRYVKSKLVDMFEQLADKREGRSE